MTLTAESFSRLKIMERLCIPGGVCTRVATHAKDSKRLAKSNLQVMQKEKRWRQEAEGVTYEPGGF